MVLTELGKLKVSTINMFCCFRLSRHALLYYLTDIKICNTLLKVWMSMRMEHLLKRVDVTYVSFIKLFIIYKLSLF